ncbi:MAG: GNAT family N-acetyltransferase, partial [Chloroflexi bacterium]
PALWAAVEARSEGNLARGDERILALFVPVEVTVPIGNGAGTLLGGPLRRLTTRAVVYGSVICAPGVEGEQALDQLLKAYRKEADGRLLFTELRNLAPVDGLRPILDRHGFAYEEHLNFLIDLDRPREEILQSISRRTRRQIRRGLRIGDVLVEEVRDRQGLAEFYGLVRQTYAAAGIPLADISLFEAALDLLVPRQMARFFLARVQGQAAACSVELLYKDTSYGWYGGMDRQYSAYVPNEILTWSIFEWSAQSGYRVYDFGGAGKPDEEYGVRVFKAKFGGELVSYGRNVCVHAPLLLNASKMGYNLFRRLGVFGSTSTAAGDGKPGSRHALPTEPGLADDDADAEESWPRSERGRSTRAGQALVNRE